MESGASAKAEMRKYGRRDIFARIATIPPKIANTNLDPAPRINNVHPIACFS
jgi:hypothetical protein